VGIFLKLNLPYPKGIMALKPTIYKVNLSISDMDRNYYNDVQLTIAQHPSENNERMMARLLAYSLNAHDDLAFTRGLSSIDEPELWLKTLDDQILQWIEVGQPEPDRLKKANTIAREVCVYSFGKSASTWWQLNEEVLEGFKGLKVSQFPYECMLELNELIQRTMDLSVSITENTLYVSSAERTVEVPVTSLKV